MDSPSDAASDVAEIEDAERDNDRDIPVLVNEKPVVLHGRHQTGLSIKRAAIDQHVDIQLDFVLSIERHGGRTEIIGDNQEIKVKKHDRFLAIPNDDNS